MMRGVSFEFRFKATGWHRELWNRLFFVGSLLAAVAQGAMLAGVVTGFAKGMAFRLFELLVGLGLAGGYALLGATWLVDQDRGRPAERKRCAGAGLALLGAALGVAAISLATPFASPRIMEKWFELADDRCGSRRCRCSPLQLCLDLDLAFGGSARTAASSRREWLPFVLAVWVFVFAFAGLAYSLYPFLVIDRITIWEAAAAESRCGSCSSAPASCCRSSSAIRCCRTACSGERRGR